MSSRRKVARFATTLAASVARGAHDVERRATAVRTDRSTAL